MYLSIVLKTISDDYWFLNLIHVFLCFLKYQKKDFTSVIIN